MINAVLAVQQVMDLEEAKKRIPDHLKDTAPYSANTLWTFYLDTEHQPEGPSCPYCKMFDGQTFTGAQLRSVFPDHKWMGDDIYANVHKTLWGDKADGTCGCLLIREPKENTNVFSMWSQIGTDWIEKSKSKEE